MDKYHKVCKVNGIFAHHEVDKDVNFITLKYMTTHNLQPAKNLYKKFQRMNMNEIVFRTEEKKFKPTLCKKTFE